MSSGVLVGSFAQYVRERHQPRPAQDSPETPYPLSQETREAISHHLIPLTLLARADGDENAVEQKVILDHVVTVLTKTGHTVGDADREKLKDYIADFRPGLMQLDPALHRLDREDSDTKIAFLGAARAVVLADGHTDPAEARLLDELKLEFARA